MQGSVRHLWLTLRLPQVTSDGEVVYQFRKDFNAVITRRSLALRMEPTIRKVAAALGFAVRFSFGSALLASVAVVWLAIAALMLSARDDNRSSRLVTQHCKC